ncbi:SpoIIE family protein phosphatase [Blastococcus sp. URHD0036]|uniref:SpoIIE family protein phosphatase n=1 Tax=Blastococcus sp. URHD0036 TaxID=1380356 RepID=UPI00049837CC|nr:SpoIIE family protein phosphatase [Blastococcus sp. URHD0036]
MAVRGILAGLLPTEAATPCQELFVGTDWAGTALGPLESWPPALLSAVSTCLTSRFPMLVMAGPELVMVYNDGYAEMLGDRHPGAMGARMDEVWADVWADIGPMLDTVRDERTPTYAQDLHLVMGRKGFAEETYFTFSYSPLLDPTGGIVGVLDTAIETTRQVLALRRLDLANRLGGVVAVRRPVLEAAASALVDVLGVARSDVPCAALYLVDGLEGGPSAEHSRLRLHATTGTGEAAVPVLVDPDRDGDRDRRGGLLAALGGEVAVLRGLDERLPGLSQAAVSGGRVDTAVALPLTTAGRQTPVGVLVLGVSPHLELDADYLAFFELLAGQMGAVLGDTLAHQAELRLVDQRLQAERAVARHSAEVATTLQRAMLGPAVLPPGFAVRYVPASAGLEVGGDWHDVVELADGAVGIVVGDVVGRGLGAAAVMGQLRSAARAVLLQSGSPGTVVAALDAVAALVPGAPMATVFCAVLDRASGRIRYSRAGHLPAVVAEPDGRTRFLYGTRSLPLAVDDTAARPEDEDLLGPGSVLLLCTDGLVEGRRRPVDAGLDRAAAVLSAARDLPEEELADHLLQTLVPGGTDDDVVLLLHRRS